MIDFNRSQFRLYMAIGQPAKCGIDTSTPHGVAVPVIPKAPSGVQPLPDPRASPHRAQEPKLRTWLWV